MEVEAVVEGDTLGGWGSRMCASAVSGNRDKMTCPERTRPICVLGLRPGCGTQPASQVGVHAAYARLVACCSHASWSMSWDRIARRSTSCSATMSASESRMNPAIASGAGSPLPGSDPDPLRGWDRRRSECSNSPRSTRHRTAALGPEHRVQGRRSHRPVGRCPVQNEPSRSRLQPPCSVRSRPATVSCCPHSYATPP